MPANKLILGTALWAWTIDKNTAFQLLDQFYAAGFRMIDAATNYPINKNAEDFRAAENILLEWINAHGIKDLEVIMKVGSINNLGVPDNNLSPSFLQMNLGDYQEKLGSNLHTLMIHWDNREDTSSIRESLKVLELALDQGIQIGLSGIKHPGLYAGEWSNLSAPYIEVKHNLLQSSIPHYQAFHGNGKFLSYGINAGGLKLSGKYQDNSSARVRGVDPSRLESLRGQLENLLSISGNDQRPTLTHFFQLSMLFSYYHPSLSGMIIGPSNSRQLQSSIEYFQQLNQYDYSDIYQSLVQLKNV